MGGAVVSAARRDRLGGSGVNRSMVRKPSKVDWLIPLAVGIGILVIAYMGTIVLALALFAPTGD